MQVWNLRTLAPNYLAVIDNWRSFWQWRV